MQYWMRFALRNETIVISMTTTPHRINSMEEQFKTILQQKRQPDAIYLSIPYVFKRDNLEYQIPDWLNKYPQVIILRTEDYGPATKLLGVLEQVNLPDDAIIITLDDDAHYPDNIILELAYYAQQHPDAAIGILGANPIYGADNMIDLNSELGIKKTMRPNAKVSILQGYTGVAYRRKFFDANVFDILQAPQDCIKSDDFYLSYFLARKNIDRIVHGNKHIFPCLIGWQTDNAQDENALHKMHPGPVVKHRACLSFLQEKYPNVDF